MDVSLAIFLALVGVLTLCEATPLDDYVNKPDPTYSYTVIDKIRGPTYTFYTVNMTSQTWKPSKNFFSITNYQPIFYERVTRIRRSKERPKSKNVRELLLFAQVTSRQHR